MSTLPFVAPVATNCAILTSGQTQIAQYLDTLAGLPLEVIVSNPLSDVHLTQSFRDAVNQVSQDGEEHFDKSSIPLLAAGCYVRNIQGHERALLKSLGLDERTVQSLSEDKGAKFGDHFSTVRYDWQGEVALAGSLTAQLGQLHESIGRALEKIKEWRGYIGVFPDALAYMKAEGELLGPLNGVQFLFSRRIQQARAIRDQFQPLTVAGLEMYFARPREPRKSGEVQKDALFDSTPPPPLAG